MVTFTFPPPLAEYHGQADTIRAELAIELFFVHTNDPKNDLGLSTLSGFIEADTRSITLGGDEIDENTHSGAFLDVATFPTRRFTIESFESKGGGVITVGEEPTPFTMHGTFQMKDKSVILQVPATLRLEQRGVNAQRLVLSAQWQLNILHPFGIPGPGAEGPANETVNFTANIKLKPAP